MNLLQQAAAGIQAIDVDPQPKHQALQYLERWLTQEDFAPYRPQLDWLIQTSQWAGLLDRFYQILPFGTGGRRGPVGVGPNRMNLWTLGASVQGHCEYLKEKFPEISPLRVVLAYDVRQFEDKNKRYNPSLPNPVLHLSSKMLAQYAAGVYVANGIHAHILPEHSTRYLATPELSFIIRRLATHGGLNISASHNPPDDNGGKFYDERGGQPIAPDDQIMADLVDQVANIKTLAWPDALRTGRIHFLDESLHTAYIELIKKQSLLPPPRLDELQIVFTPLHGVGGMTAMEVLVQHGFRVRPVEEQMQPDGQFTNVTQTPNPEVPVSMDRAEALAASLGADLVLATDPDADRLGAMVALRERGRESFFAAPSTEKSEPAAVGREKRLPTPLPPAPQLLFLNGNTLAALLTHFKLAKLTEQGRMPKSPIVVKTLLTTSLITRIARHFKAQIVENLLVGFKYIAEVLWQLEQHGCYEDVQGTPEDFLIAAEESHGILVTPHIRDKDAAGAALLMAELALDCKRRGETVLDYLDAVERRHGHFYTEVTNIVLPGIEGKQTMARMLNLLRTQPPKDIGGLPVTGVDDLLDERCWLGPFKGATDRAARNFLHIRLGEQARIGLRPSGTEPKIKTYIEVSSPPCPAHTAREAWRQACQAIDDKGKKLGDAFLNLATELRG